MGASKPALVFPYAEHDRALFPQLRAILPDLKGLFACAYLCRPPASAEHAEVSAWLTSDDFFQLIPVDQRRPVGERFTCLYVEAARQADPRQALHLAYLDRLAFALRTGHRASFRADVAGLGDADLPVVFQRSTVAWATHPANYARLERFVTGVGERLFGAALDYTWCYLAVRAGELREVMTAVTHSGLSMVGEMVLRMQDHLRTREVDWLSWEDPFILGRDPAQLKAEREASASEYDKRLGYCLPIVEAMLEAAVPRR